MPDPNWPRLIAASRDAGAWPAEPRQWRPAPPAAPRRDPLPARLRLFLLIVSWFAALGLIWTITWLIDGIRWLLKGAGV